MGSFDHLLQDRTPDKTDKTDKTPEHQENKEGFGGSVSFVSDPGDIAERAAIIRFDAGVPEEWAVGYGSLQGWMPQSLLDGGYTPERWQRVIDDGGKFLDQWGAQAAALGWNAADVFGVHPDAPTTRIDAMGLVFLIDGRTVQAITAQSARLVNERGGALTYYRRTSSQKGMPVWSIL